MVSNKLNTKFALKLRIAKSDIPVNVKFNSKYFARTPKPTQEGQAFMLSLDRDSIVINNIPLKEPTNMSVIQNLIDGCLIRQVRNSENS